MSKRKRDPAFAPIEKMTLVELVAKYYNTVESKKTDAVSIKVKNEEWQKITAEFNSISSIHSRDWITLKNCWENLKKRAKHENSLQTQNFLGTGNSLIPT